MKKPLLIITLLLCTAVSFSQTPQQGEIDYVFTAGDINYKITSIAPDPDTVEVIDSPSATGDILIPETVDDGSVTYSVTTIGDSAFYLNALKSVVIPDSITTIGDYAFYVNALTSVVIPDSITTIGDYAFYYNALTTVNIPDSVTTIGNYAFSRNALTSVAIPDSITTIGQYIFAENELTSVVIPENVTTIGNFAFYENKLTTVNIPDRVTTIGENTFAKNDLTSIEIPENVTSIGRAAFYLNLLTSVVIPDSVTTIGDVAFYYNDLTTVEIPDSITSIGYYAFGANALTTVEIPENVTSIGTYAFFDNDLISVVLKSLTPPSIGADTFDDRSGITLTVPAGTKTDYENNGWTGFLDIIEASTLGINNIALNDADVALLIADNQLKVTTGTSQLKHYKIYSITGANVLNSNQNTVSIAHLSHGVYVAVLTLNSGVISKKFAK